MRDYVRLSEAIPEGINGNGIFAALSGMPWDADISGSLLDIEYFGNISGDKIVSPLLDKKLAGTLPLSSSALADIVGIIKGMFLRNWNSLYTAMTADYNPIHNYDMTEESTDTLTGNENGTDTGTVTNSGKITYGREIKTLDDNANIVKQSVAAFNSSDYSPANENITDETLEQTVINSGDDTTSDQRTDNLMHNKTRNENTTHQLKRAGNIGVTTSQQLIESEIELRRKNFFSQVFRDVDSILTIRIY